MLELLSKYASYKSNKPSRSLWSNPNCAMLKTVAMYPLNSQKNNWVCMFVSPKNTLKVKLILHLKQVVCVLTLLVVYIGHLADSYN